MAHAVILEHRLEDGSVHFDWMIEDERISLGPSLWTWRVVDRPDLAEGFVGERIANHRGRYLTFEGDIGGGRGSVRRIRSGSVRAARLGDEALKVTIDWAGESPMAYAGRVVDLSPNRWVFSRSYGSPP
jgi:hypothetical protein